MSFWMSRNLRSPPAEEYLLVGVSACTSWGGGGRWAYFLSSWVQMSLVASQVS